MPDFLIETSTPFSEPKALSMPPFCGVTGFHKITVLQNDKTIELDVILYAGKSYYNDPDKSDNGIAIANNELGIVIDQIGCDSELKAEIFSEACSISNINMLHEFMFKYGKESRYRGQFD